MTAFSETEEGKDSITTSELSITLAVSRLQELAKGLKASPSDKLITLLTSLKEDPSEKVWYYLIKIVFYLNILLSENQ